MFGVSLGNLVVHIGVNAGPYYTGIKRVQEHLNSTGKNFQSIGRTMTTYFTLPLVYAGVKGIKTFGKFDQAMAHSTAIMGDLSDKMIQTMKDTARTTALESKFSADQLAKGYYYLASAGLNAEQSVASLGTVNKFATAGMFDMARATELLVGSQSALGLTVKDATENQKNMIRVADVLVKANTLAQASTEQFAEALATKAAAEARSLGKDVEEVVAVLAAFASQNTRAANAGERFYQFSRDIQRAIVKQPAAWRRLGISVYDTNGKMLNYATIIKQLERHFSGLSDEQKRVTVQMLGFQDRSYAALKMLLGFGDIIGMFEQKLRMAGGAMDEVAHKNLQNIMDQFAITRNHISELAITMGTILLPAIEDLNEKIRKMVLRFKALNPETQEFITRITVATAIVLAFLGPFYLLLGVFIRFVAFVIGAGKAIVFISSLMMSWVGVVLLVVASAGFLYIAWKNNLWGIQDITYSVVNYLIDTWDTFIDKIIEVIQWIGKLYRKFSTGIAKAILSGATGIPMDQININDEENSFLSMIKGAFIGSFFKPFKKLQPPKQEEGTLAGTTDRMFSEFKVKTKEMLDFFKGMEPSILKTKSLVDDFLKGFMDQQSGLPAIINEFEDLQKTGLFVAQATTSGMRNAFSQTFQEIIKGTVTLEEAFLNLGNRILDVFIQITAEILAMQAVAGIVKAGTSLSGMWSSGSIHSALGWSTNNYGDKVFGGKNTNLYGPGYALGGIAPGGFKAFASGSPVVNKPTLGLVGEGAYNEAVVPLPDGRSIPVEMRGGKAPIINMVVQAWDSSDVQRNMDTITGMLINGLRQNSEFRGALKQYV